MKRLLLNPRYLTRPTRSVNPLHQTAAEVITQLFHPTVTFTQGRAVQLASPGVKALTADSPAQEPAATILQCAAQPGDAPQQFYIQGGQVLIQGKVQPLHHKSTWSL